MLAMETDFITNHFLGDLGEAERLHEAGRMKLVDGEAEIADGVHVHALLSPKGGRPHGRPGHHDYETRGRGGGDPDGVSTARPRLSGWAVLAVDAAYLYRSLESMIPPGIHIHVDDALRALDKVKDLADATDLIFAGHDETDLRREEVFPGVRRFV